MIQKAKTRKNRLRHYLDAAREAVLWKASELPEQQLRQPMTPTGSTILGIVNHLAFIEFGYFGYCLKRPVDSERAIMLFRSEQPLADFVVEAETSAGQVLEFYRAALTAADAAFDELELDAPAEVPWWGENATTTLEHLMVHVIAETSRHAGHLDILREQLDGRAGIGPEDANLPDFGEREWREHVQRLRRIADSM